MLQVDEVEQIVQQLTSQEEEANLPYLGFFCDDHNPEYWYIKANQAGLRKYAADLLRASISPSSIEAGSSSNVGLNSSWLDETGDAQPLFVQFVAGSNHIAKEAGNNDPSWPLKVGCWLAALTLGGILLAGIKEIIDLLRA